MELGNVGTSDGDGDGDGMTPPTHRNEAREIDTGHSRVPDRQTKTLCPPNPFGSFFNVHLCQSAATRLHDEHRC